MTRDELLEKLRGLAPVGEENSDYETTHWDADHALLDFINDPEIKEAWDAVGKWWA